MLKYISTSCYHYQGEWTEKKQINKTKNVEINTVVQDRITDEPEGQFESTRIKIKLCIKYIKCEGEISKTRK